MPSDSNQRELCASVLTSRVKWGNRRKLMTAPLFNIYVCTVFWWTAFDSLDHSYMQSSLREVKDSNDLPCSGDEQLIPKDVCFTFSKVYRCVVSEFVHWNELWRAICTVFPMYYVISSWITNVSKTFWHRVTWVKGKVVVLELECVRGLFSFTGMWWVS